ncbi:MAG: FadR family transcriptional regulator [Actinobacteria bacterium]|nr:FadR family transcriptional regulator [Actinomycetota bacterium]
MNTEDLKSKKSIQVFRQIIEDIKTQKLNGGDVLPSEAELSKRYSVGRGSIREALNALEALGIVKKQVGIGTILEDFTLESIFNPAGLLFELDYNNLKQVLDFREIFEEIVLKMLPGKITDKDIENLEEILALTKFYHERNDKKKFAEYDYKFHQVLASSTHNIVIISIFNMIYPFLKYILSQTVDIPENLIETINDHSEIIELIKVNNIAATQIVIKRHIQRVKKFLKETIKKDDISSDFVQ